MRLAVVSVLVLAASPAVAMTISQRASEPRIGLGVNVGFFEPPLASGLGDRVRDDGTPLVSLSLARYFDGSSALGLGQFGLELSAGTWRVEGDPGLRVTPLAASLVWRNDLLRRHLDVPLLLYAEIGGDYYRWSADGAMRLDGDESGGTAGMHVGAALGIDLDFGRPMGGKTYTSAALVLRVEQAFIDGFGTSREHYDFSATQVSLGLAIDI